MNINQRPAAVRALVLIAAEKLTERAVALYREEKVAVQHRLHAQGTASDEIMDLLGLGRVDKSILVSIMPKALAEETLKKLHRELRLDTVNSGIAFTIPLSGANNLVLRMLGGPEAEQPRERREDTAMSEMKYTLIAAVVNQGFSEEVMEAARTAGAGGGTVFHSRRIAEHDTVKLWGLSVQEEKETVMILAEAERKLAIMQAIGERCGIRSEAKGIVLSLPVEDVLGLGNL